MPRSLGEFQGVLKFLVMTKARFLGRLSEFIQGAAKGVGKRSSITFFLGGTLLVIFLVPPPLLSSLFAKLLLPDSFYSRIIHGNSEKRLSFALGVSLLQSWGYPSVLDQGDLFPILKKKCLLPQLIVILTVLILSSQFRSVTT